MKRLHAEVRSCLVVFVQGVKLKLPFRIPAVLAACLLLLLASACATAGRGEPDQMHGNAPVGDAGSAEETESPEEDSMLHTSPVQLTGTETAVVTTSKGTFTLTFYQEDAPNTVASFVELAEAGFYNGIKFHRVIPGFVAQGGDPLTRDLTPDQVKAGAPGVGTGGPGWNQKAEFNDRKHETGTLAMARARDVDSAGSQFYVCLAPQPQLDGDYTVFGQVVDGMDVVMAIEVGDVIESVTISR